MALNLFKITAPSSPVEAVALLGSSELLNVSQNVEIKQGGERGNEFPLKKNEGGGGGGGVRRSLKETHFIEAIYGLIIP